MSKQPMKTFVPGKGLIFRYAHIKRDGNYTNVFRNSAGRVYVYTSNPTDITDEVQWLPQFETFERLPLRANIIGELWVPGEKAEGIKTAIKNQDTRLRFDCFGILHWPEHPAIHLIEQLALDDCKRIIENAGLGWVPHFRLADMNVANQLMQQIAQGDCSACNADVEGLVFKNGNLADWHKWKPRKTIDLVIKGFEAGKGKYLNQIGAIICETTEGYEVANVSGMTDLQRAYMSANTDNLIGQVVEVAYQNVGNQGRLRHPVFERMRHDKTREQCRAEQDETLAKRWTETLPLFDK